MAMMLKRLLENIKESFDANGISIPYPQRDLHIINDDGGSDASTISPELLAAPVAAAQVQANQPARQVQAQPSAPAPVPQQQIPQQPQQQVQPNTGMPPQRGN